MPLASPRESSFSPRHGVALLIGVGDYEQGKKIPPLKYAVNDVKGLAEVLTDSEIAGFSAEKVKTLINEEAHRDAVVRHLSKWMPEQGSGAEIAILFFAGHGMVHRMGSQEEGYLLPHDADPDDVITKGISMGDVSNWIKATRSKSTVVILDCCHAGNLIAPSGTAFRAVPRDLGIRPRFLEQIVGEGQFLIAACKQDQKSLEVEEFQHGLFTYHLIHGLRGQADRDRDGRVSVGELLAYVTERVSQEARQRFEVEQTPWGRLEGQANVYLTRTGAVLPLSGHSSGSWPSSPNFSDQNLRELEQEIEKGAKEARLLQILEWIAQKPAAESIPILFRCLADRSTEVRSRSRDIVKILGWPSVMTQAKQIVNSRNDLQISFLLEGLAAFESNEDVVRLLERLVLWVKGKLRHRAILLLERKQLGLGLSRVAKLFQEIQSPFELTRVLGAGLYTAAYLAIDKENELNLVVRVLRPEFVGQPRLVTEFMDLGRRCYRLHHHNLMHTRDTRDFPDHQLYYTVRDYVEGASLRDVLEQGRKFKLGEVLKLVRQVAEALSPLHRQQACHGGVKPSNIFFSTEGPVILGDPSLTLPPPQQADLDRLTYDYRYAPPEAFRSQPQLEPRSDFYCLGCVIHELLWGEPPFVSDDHFKLSDMHRHAPVEPPNPSPVTVPASWVDFLRKAMEKEPADRFLDLDEFLEALQNLEHPPSPPRSDSSGDPGPGGPDAEGGPPEEGDKPPNPNHPPVFLGPADDPSAFSEVLSSPSESGPVESLMEYIRNQSIVDGITQTHGPVQEDEFSVPSRPSPPSPERFGRYRILKRLGMGGMGEVYLARDESLDREVAIKMIRQSESPPDVTQRFMREAQVVARLSHQHICPIFDVGVDEAGRMYFVMKFVEGRPLSDLTRGGDPLLDQAQVAGLIAKIADALAYAHQQRIVHRDVKPSNIMVDQAGEPIILDFGLATFEKGEALGSSLTHSGQFMGTPAYMAPEQAFDVKNAGPQADIYSLGCVMFELLTGQRPFQGSTMMELLVRVREERPRSPREINPSVSRSLERICLKCLEKDPARRYASAEDLASALKGYLKKQPAPIKLTASEFFQREHARESAGSELSLEAGERMATVPIRPKEQPKHCIRPKEQPKHWKRPLIVAACFLVLALLALIGLAFLF